MAATSALSLSPALSLFPDPLDGQRGDRVDRVAEMADLGLERSQDGGLISRYLGTTMGCTDDRPQQVHMNSKVCLSSYLTVVQNILWFYPRVDTEHRGEL